MLGVFIGVLLSSGTVELLANKPKTNKDNVTSLSVTDVSLTDEANADASRGPTGAASSSLVSKFDDPKSKKDIPRRFEQILGHKGKFYAAPFNEDYILVYDAQTKEVTKVSTAGIETGLAKWSNVCLGDDDRIYFAPNSAKNLLIYDVSANRVSGVPMDPDFATGVRKWAGSAVAGNILYAIPFIADVILIYDTVSGATSNVSTMGVATGEYKWTGAVVHEGKVYGSPWAAMPLLVYDVESKDATGVDTTRVYSGSEIPRWEGIAKYEGKIYSAPVSAGQILVYDTATGIVSGISTAAAFSGTPKWGGTVAYLGKIYGSPSSEDAPLLVLDIKTGQISGVSRTGVADGVFIGLAADAGKIVGAPYTHDRLLVYDTETGNLTGECTPETGDVAEFGIDQEKMPGTCSSQCSD